MMLSLPITEMWKGKNARCYSKTWKHAVLLGLHLKFYYVLVWGFQNCTIQMKNTESYSLKIR